MDVTRLRADGIEADLALRDFTVNAIAVPLAEPAAPPLDPHGGLADLEARVLRAVSARSFADDPLRILRAARIAAGLALEVDPETARARPRGGAGGRRAARASASSPSCGCCSRAPTR